MFKKLALSLVAASGLFSAASQAHFQMVYTPDLLREKGGEITLKMPFTHPADNGHVMAVEKPEQFYVIKKVKNRSA